MFDLAWSEIALIAVVALLVIGPKDLPTAIRGIAQGIQKLRRMAGQFQSQADELVREAKLDDVRNTINEIRSFDLKGQITKAVDGDGTLRDSFSDPMKPSPPAWTPPPPAPTGEAPAFIPPPPAPWVPPPLPEPPVAPAFIPPGASPPPAQHSA